MAKRKPEGPVADFYEWMILRHPFCRVPGCSGRAELHHARLLISPKTGLLLPRRKGINYWAVVPLCPTHHRTGENSLHAIGEARFFELHGIKGLEEWATNLMEWLEEYFLRSGLYTYPSSE